MATRREGNAEFAKSLARAFAGAVIFGLPMLMTMEMWQLGFSVPPWKLALLLTLFFPFLVVLSWHAGFEKTFSWRDDLVDALVAYAVGAISATVILGVLGILEPQMSRRELVGVLSLQAVPGSIGALLAQTQLGERKAREETGDDASSYASELFVMAVGALFLAFNIAPTEEMLLIALRMQEWHALLLVALSLAAMHAFVYSVGFHGQPKTASDASRWGLLLRFTVAGYVLALLLSAYILWSFGRLDGMSLASSINAVTVLGFPAAIGAAAARLIL